jgi:hypothetical protein
VLLAEDDSDDLFLLADDDLDDSPVVEVIESSDVEGLGVGVTTGVVEGTT